MRVSQPVALHADVYGGDTVYHGKLVGLAAGSGSAFALLPAQNATGNWIKIVQRVPVRVALDPAELEAHPLQVGLSMQVKVDTHEQAGERLPRVARAPASDASAVFSSIDHLADERVKAIIAVNEGRAAARSLVPVARDATPSSGGNAHSVSIAAAALK